jgi:serine/threonine-protein kinase RsbT
MELAGLPKSGPATPGQSGPADLSVLDLRVRIDSTPMVVFARQKGRHLARQAGFSALDAALIATAVSELARCLLRRTGDGDLTIRFVEAQGRQGILLQAHDEGPVLTDPAQAIREGKLGAGLRRVIQLMDDVTADSAALQGTTFRVTKWLASWRAVSCRSPWMGCPES